MFRLCILPVLLSITAAAQAYTLQGVIASAGNIPLPGASVVIFAAENDSVPVAGTSSNEKGLYSLQADCGSYRLRASFLGYKTVWREVKIAADTRLDTIVMPVDTIQAKEVTVTAHFIKHEPNSITIAMQGNPLARNSSAYDMLYKLPGTYGLSIYGQAVSKIYIDDQEVASDIATSMLQSMRAEDVESFELIPIAGVEYGATTEGSVLRIRLKKKRENGSIISVSAGTEIAKQSVSLYPKIYAMTKLGKVEAVTSFGYSNIRSKPIENLNIYTYNNGSHLKEKITHSTGKVTDYTMLSQSVTYNLNSKHKMGIRFDFTWRPNGQAESYTDYYDNSSGLTFPLKSHRYSDLYYRHYKAYAFYQWNFDNRGSFLQANIQYYTATQRDWSEIFNTFSDGSTQTIGTDLPLSHAVLYPQIIFRKNFANGMSLLIGAKYLHTTGNLFQTETTAENSGPEKTDTRPYDYDENLYSAYAQWSGNLFSNRLNYQLGVNVEHIDTRHMFSDENPTTRFRSTGLFPSAALQYNIDSRKGHFLSLSYAPYTSYPTGYSLDPNWTRTGTFSYFRGNPNLKAPYNHRLQIRQTLWNAFTINLSGTWQINPVAMRDSIGADGQTRYRSRENFGSYNNYSLSLYYNKRVLNWLWLNAMAKVYCNYENSRQYGRRTYWSGDASAWIYFYLPQNWQIYGGANFMGEYRRYNTVQYPFVEVYCGVNKSFFNNSLVINASIRNLQGGDRISRTYYDNYFVTTHSNANMIFCQISIRYTFNIGKKDIRVREVQTDNLPDERTRY